MRLGLDYLGGAKFKKLIIDQHPMGWAGGIFAETFGDAYSVVDELLATGRCPHFRVQLMWSDVHSFGDKDIPTITRLAKRYNVLARKYPHVILELSPFCEYNGLPNIDKYLDIVKANAPQCVPIASPNKGNKNYSKRYRNEVHRDGGAIPSSGSYNFSYDGISAVDADIDADKLKYANCDLFFLWIPQMNGRRNSEDKTPRPQRKFFPDAKQLDSLIYIGNNLKGGTQFPAKWIGKSHADQHKMPREPRASKPVYITPPNFKPKSIELRADNGQLVGRLTYGGEFRDKATNKLLGYRYYSASGFGYEMSEKAKRLQKGKAICSIYADGKFCGTCNPAFRDGTFRV